MRKIILSIAVSIDGFIADELGGIKWLAPYENTGEDYGYKHFLASVDTLLIGRKTYEQTLTFGEWPYPKKRVYVFTREMKKNLNEGIIFSDHPEKIARDLKTKKGKDIWLVGGSEIIALLREGELIDEMIIVFIPELLGKGIPLFKQGTKQAHLNLVDLKKYDNGIVQGHYKVEKRVIIETP